MLNYTVFLTLVAEKHNLLLLNRALSVRLGRQSYFHQVTTEPNNLM